MPDTRELASEVRPPLTDVTVTAVEQFGAGAWATVQLADLGATVIKVEGPSSCGDVGRYVYPYRFAVWAP